MIRRRDSQGGAGRPGCAGIQGGPRRSGHPAPPGCPQGRWIQDGQAGHRGSGNHRRRRADPPPRPADGKVVTWAAGSGAVSQSLDPAHPDELLLIADRPGPLMLHVRVGEGLTKRRETRSVTAVPDVTPGRVALLAPAVPARMGPDRDRPSGHRVRRSLRCAGQPDLTSADFIALVVPLAALLGVIAVARGTSDQIPAPATSRIRPPTPAAAGRYRHPHIGVAAVYSASPASGECRSSR